MQGRIAAGLVVALWVSLLVAGWVPVAGAQGPLPVNLSLKVAGHGSSAVEVRGTTLPGSVVAVRGASKVVDESGKFMLKTTMPVYLVAVKGGQLRRLTLRLPEGAPKWLDRLTIGLNLTKMRAEVDGALTIKNHPPATVTVEHVQAGQRVDAPLRGGEFSLDLPVVQKTNTLDWTLRAGWIRWTAPALTFDVQ